MALIWILEVYHVRYSDSDFNGVVLLLFIFSNSTNDRSEFHIVLWRVSLSVFLTGVI